MTPSSDLLNVSVGQISPVWLNKKLTLEKIGAAILEAVSQGSQLVCFGETLLPGYPFWLSITNGSNFNNDMQKEIFAHYLKEAVSVEDGDLKQLQQICAENKIALYLGCAEKAKDRGGCSIYCSLVYIDALGEIKSVHRKLMPTFEERLVWSIGDGNGLKVHQLGAFKLGGLNCWENWMPLARTALYAQGENLHVATWPGGLQNTIDLTRHIALENRMYVISVSGLLNKHQISDDIPHFETIRQNAPENLANGGSCIAKPDGTWLLKPLGNEETVITVTIDFNEVRKEKQNFDPMGHYSRPDILQLNVNRERQAAVFFKD
jgi:nitrilase